MTTKILMIGADIGKRHDPTAIAVAVCERRKNAINGHGETHFTIPALRRLLPLGQPYPRQAEELIRIAYDALDRFKNMTGVDHYAEPYPRFFIDCTGIGEAMVDLLKPRLSDKFHVLPCRFVHSDNLGVAHGEYRPGKSWFANRLQVLSEGHLIHISPTNPDAEAAATELLDFDVNIDEATGVDRYGAMRPNTHDDLVCALGMACLIDPFKYLGYYNE